MRATLLLIFLLLLPGAEVYTLFQFFASAPLWASLYLLTATGVGWLLVRAAKVGFAETLRRLADGVGRGESPRALFVFGKLWAVGALLFFPGYITDFIALLLLLTPGVVFREERRRGGGTGGEKIVDVEGREDSDAGR